MEKLTSNVHAIPNNAIGSLNGLYYKIGLHGFSYYWNGDSWLRSQKSAILIEAALEKCRHKFSLNNEV
tara:strand:- start:644 stop:847 length:204 start_codon:yes stop_codon:yes gene_type:complete